MKISRLLFLISSISAQSPEFIGDILGRTYITDSDALQSYTSLSVDEIEAFLGVPFSFHDFHAEHDFDGFFVDLMEAFPMRLMLKTRGITDTEKNFDGVGFDLDGEPFDVLGGVVNNLGEWTFVKSYNGRGPHQWSHSWYYKGEMRGLIWSGGLNFPGAPTNAKPLAQLFFYPNATEPNLPPKPEKQSLIPSDLKPLPHCIERLSTIRDTYLLTITGTIEQRKFSKRIGHLILMLENVSRNQNKKGVVANLSPISDDFRHRIRLRLSDLNKVCFNRLIKERYQNKQNLGKHLTTRAKNIFKHICLLTDAESDKRFCRGK